MGNGWMNIQKKIVLGLVILWAILLVLFGLARSGLLIRGKVEVFFFQKQADNSWLLVSVRRPLNKLVIDQSRKIRYALEQLISGPDADETSNGFISCMPPETQLLGVRVDDGLIYVDFDDAVEMGGGIEEINGRLAQIVFTATQFKPEAGVRLLINGKEIKSFSGEGITEVEKPMYRTNFSDFTKGKQNEGENTS